MIERFDEVRENAMSDKTIRVRVFRYDPSIDGQPSFTEYAVPCEKGMSAMDALDYIYHNLDGSLAYYDHAGCSLGICGKCTGRINGKAGLFCQTLIDSDTVLEPVNPERVIRDLVTGRRQSPAE